MVRNLRRARHKWARLTRVLSREGVDDRTLGHIDLAVVLLLLLFGSETWVLTPHMEKVLGGFHHTVDRRLIGRQPRKGQDGGWVYPLMEDVMAEVGLQEVETYFSCRQNTVEKYIVTRPIMDLCLVANRRPGPRMEMQW